LERVGAAARCGGKDAREKLVEIGEASVGNGLSAERSK
jgi:hypothetical protein